ncbi:ATP-binding protein [Kitasatospora sp. NPDC057512]|uniref:ATP-binding protein n=1 Tax=Kitasatospora sp. NPDC057512 TaxID=3346154 RepID=UPI0036ACF13D
MESGSRIITTKFPAEREQIGELRRWAKAAMPLLGLDLGDRQCGDLLDDVELVLSELGTNAVLHGCGGDRPDVKLTASLAYASGVLRVSVADPGDGRPECRPTSTDATCGRGLRLVIGVASRSGVENLPEGGKEIWAEIELPDPVRPVTVVVDQVSRQTGMPRSETAVRDSPPRPACGRLPGRPALDRTPV